MVEQKYISGRDIHFVADEQGHLCLRMPDGTAKTKIKPRRLLPISAKDMYIDLRGEKGEEYGILKGTDELDRDSRECLESELNRYYTIPRILELHKIEEKYGIIRWFVTTDRGKREFEIQNRSADIKLYPPRRVVIRDTDDNRYEIADYLELPASSFAKLQGEI